jgi:acyl-CoA synthetase (AMP-forming)/AMP-acid ligase II
MSVSTQLNFAARLVERLGDGSELKDAPSGEVISGAKLATAVADFAAGFAEAGLVPGDRVLIASNLRPMSSIAYLGAMFGGLVAVPLNENLVESSGEAPCRKTRARALWSERELRCDWADRVGVLHIKGKPPTSDHASDHQSRLPAGCREHDLAALMATSGTTAAPRFVKVSHGNLIANTEAIIRSQRLGKSERAMLILPVSYCFGASVLHTHLYQGGSVVFDSRFMFPDKVLRAIGQHGCTTFAGVPMAYNILLRRSSIRSIPLPTLRRFLQAGGALPPERVRQLREIVPHAEVFVMYGQTEATSRIACLPPARWDEKAGSVGVPLDNLSVRIVDAEGAEAAAGQSGELMVAGESICAGYLDEPEETARKFRDGWLATGDIAYRDRDGYLWITGRMGEFIKMRGVRVSFAEIEGRVAALPGVAECAAAAVSHAEAGEAMALYVVVTGDADDVAASIRRAIPSEWVCDSVNIVPELPRNANGKLMRSRLAEIVRIPKAVSSEAPAA